VNQKVVLVIGAVVAAVFGILLIASPDTLLGGVGLDAHGDGIIVGRDLGVMELGIAVLNWVGRKADGRGLRAILAANVFTQFAGMVLNGAEIVTHQLPGAAWPQMSVHAVLFALFGLALAATRDRSRRRADKIAAETLG
jgi:hypothetical protein